MATLSNSLIFLCLLFLPGVLAFAGPHGERYPCPYDCPPLKEIQLHMYSHQFPPTAPNPNEVDWPGWAADHGWLLTWGPDPNQNIAGRARGFHLLTGETAKDWYISHIYVFQDARFAGSTIQVLGMLDGEWSIIGGTGAFYNARGYIKYKESTITNHVLRELDVHIFTPATSTVAIRGTVPI